MTVESASGSPPAAGLGLALTAFSAATFGFGTTFARLAYDGGSDPLTIVLLRTAVFVIAVGVGMALLRRLAWLGRRPLVATLWMAVTLAVVALGYQGSVAYIPVGLAALIFYSFPLMVGLIAMAAGRDRLTLPKALALLAAFVGLGLALGPGSGLLDWRGIALALLAAVGMALTMTFGGEATRGQDALVMSLYTNFWMLIALALVAAFAGSVAVPVTGLGMAGAAGVCLSYVVAYCCWYLALSLISPVRLAGLFNIEPLVTLVAAWLVLGERLSALQIVGAALVLASILGITLYGSTERRDHARRSAAPS